MTTETNKSIDLTDAAMSRIRKVMSSGDGLQSKFRVYVTGGGCSGFIFNRVVYTHSSTHSWGRI